MKICSKNRKVRVNLEETNGIFRVLDQKGRLVEEKTNNRIKVRRLIGDGFRKCENLIGFEMFVEKKVV